MGNENKKLTSTKKLKLLFTIVRKAKADYFVDLIESMNTNMQMVVIGNGRTKSAIFSDEIGTKAIILSIVSDDNIRKILRVLEEKFSEIRDGKGVAAVVPLSSVMEVTFFNFLSNNREGII